MHLADGTRIAVAGASHLSIDPDKRRVELVRGRATFTVTHDSAHPFSVQLGQVSVADVGTVFDVHRGESGVDIAVAEGEVRVVGAGRPVPVTAGRTLHFDGAEPRVGAIDPALVGSWRRGRFSYAAASVTEVARDIEAATGQSIRVAPAVAGGRFSGSIQIEADAGDTLRAVAPLLGVSVTRQGGTWILGSADDAGRRE